MRVEFHSSEIVSQVQLLFDHLNHSKSSSQLLFLQIDWRLTFIASPACLLSFLVNLIKLGAMSRDFHSTGLRSASDQGRRLDWSYLYHTSLIHHTVGTVQSVAFYISTHHTQTRKIERFVKPWRVIDGFFAAFVKTKYVSWKDIITILTKQMNYLKVCYLKMHWYWSPTASLYESIFVSSKNICYSIPRFITWIARHYCF